MMVCAGAIVLLGDKVLLVRQAGGHALAGQWSIPWGIVDEHESPEDAALRETFEEGGIKAEIEGLLGIQNLPGQSGIGIVFVCHHVEGTPSPDGVETDQAAYFSLEDIDTFNEPIETWCEWIIRRVLCGEYGVVLPEPDNPYRPKQAFL